MIPLVDYLRRPLAHPGVVRRVKRTAVVSVPAKHAHAVMEPRVMRAISRDERIRREVQTIFQEARRLRA